MDAGFEAQTGARLGELERALRECINKVEATETEVRRLGAVGQNLTGLVDQKVKELEQAIGRVQAVEVDTRQRMDEIVGHAKKEFDELKDRLDATDNALAGTVLRAERSVKELDGKANELNQRSLDLKEEVERTKEAAKNGIDYLGNVSNNIVEKVVELERTITTARQDPTILNGVMEQVRKLEEGIKEKKEDEDKERKGREGRPILEMKSVLDIGMLGDDKTYFSTWTRDMVNTLDNVRPGLGRMMEWLGKLKVGKEDKLHEEWEEELRSSCSTGEECKLEWEKMNRDLWAVMNKKTDGLAKRKVETVERGQGIRAFYLVSKWYQAVTGLSITEARSKLMMPAQAKKESEILGRIEGWKKEMRELECMEGSISGMEGSMNDKVRVTAIKRILTGTCRDYMNQREEDYQLDHDEGEMPYERYVMLITRYLTRKAFEGDTDTGKGMYKVDGEPDADWNWVDEWQDWGSIDAVSGYGKSKGKGGACYNCGMMGHRAADCRKGKGKGGKGPGSKGGGKGPGMYWGGGGQGSKGKGGGKDGIGKGTVFTGKCHECGVIGHSARFCPKLGKGFSGTCHGCGLVGHTKGRCPKGKGKGGISEVGEGQEGGEEGKEEEGGEEGGLKEIGSLRFGGGFYKLELKNRFEGLNEGNEPEEELNLGNILGLESAESKGKEEFKEEDGWKSVKGKKVMRAGSGNGGIPAVPKANEGRRPEGREKGKDGKVKFATEHKGCQGCEDENCDKKEGKSRGGLMKVSSTTPIDEEWEWINVTVDSGAVDHVVDKECGKQFGRRETEMSRRKGYYTAANDTKIYNEGEREVSGFTAEGRQAGMTFQVCAVNGPLGAVRKMCREGNRVVFDEDGSYIEHKGSGIRTKINDVGESYVLRLRVPKKTGAKGFARRE